MRRRPAVAATALLGVVLAVMAASSGASGGSREHSLAVRSVLASVVVTLAGLGLLAILVLMVRSLLARRGKGVERTKEKVPVPLILKMGALVLLALVVLALYFLFSTAHGHRPRPAGLGASHAPPAPRRATGPLVPFDGTASFLTAVVGVGLFALLLLRKRLISLFRPASPPLAHLQMAPSQPAGAPSGPVSQLPLPDPTSFADPRQAVLAAYARFSALMTRRGNPRKLAETVFEYENRLELPPETGKGAKLAAGELSDLFALARYSEAGIGEEDRRRAINHLAEIEQHLAAGG